MDGVDAGDNNAFSLSKLSIPTSDSAALLSKSGKALGFLRICRTVGDFLRLRNASHWVLGEE